MINIVLYSIGVLTLLLLIAYIHYRFWRGALMKKLLAGSKLITLSCGQVEYAVQGEGPVILIAHGGAIGYDNIYAYDYLVKEGFKLICPSRPGYLRTKLSVADTFEKQADMFAELLDKLEIKEKVGVLALSMGGPSALQFVLCHPQKVQCLVMQDAVSQEYHANKESESSVLGKLFLSPFGREIISYMMDICTRLWPQSIFQEYLKVESKYDKTEIVKIAKEVMSNKKDVAKLLQMSGQISPMSVRYKGVDLDMALGAKIPRWPLEQISVPTLVTHSRKDNDVPFSHGEFTAQTVKNAEFYQFDGCGHMFWFGPEGDKLQAKLIEFLKKNLK